MRKRALATDVRTSEELAVAGCHRASDPARIVVRGDTLPDPELLCAANVGVGRVIIDEDVSQKPTTGYTTTQRPDIGVWQVISR